MPYDLKPISRDEMNSIQKAKNEEWDEKERQKQNKWVESTVKSVYTEIMQHLSLPRVKDYYKSYICWDKTYLENPEVRALLVDNVKEVFPGCDVYLTHQQQDTFGILYIGWTKDPVFATS